MRPPQEQAVVFRERCWPLRQLSEADYDFWEKNGFVSVKGCVPVALCQQAAAAIRCFVGASEDDRPSWYKNELDIYNDLTASGTKPAHGPCGMVQLYHHSTLWQLRQHPNVYASFSDLYGTEALWVTTDRAHFKPPEDDAFPLWSNAGPVHTGLHWDVATDEDSLPVPFVVQGVIYLERTLADQGALRVVPQSHRRLRELRDRRDRLGSGAFAADSVPVVGEAGTLVLWHSALLHGPGRNVMQGGPPRVSAYVAMLPVDAAPFNGGRRHDAPLSLADAATLAYDDNGKRDTLVRLDRTGRLRRWRERLPLLDEDPREDEVECWPPGEENAPPFAALTHLGRKLVGLDAW